MRYLIATLVLLSVFAVPMAHAKRVDPPSVPAVIHKGVSYAAPNDNGRRAYVQAWDVATNKMLWEVTVFRNTINPFLEEDVQHVFIKSMSIREEKLILVAENRRVYSVDLKTRAVERLKDAPPATQVNHALHWTGAAGIVLAVRASLGRGPGQ